MIHTGRESSAILEKGGENMKKSESSLRREIETLKRKLAGLGDMRPGSVSVQSRKWGGEYCQLSYTHRGKGHTEYIPKKSRAVVERQTANYHRFRELTQKWIDAEIELCKIKLRETDEG
jgi:hypothetical protein